MRAQRAPCCESRVCCTTSESHAREHSATRPTTFYEHERIGAEIAEPLLARLRFSNDERARIVGLVRHHLICYEDSWSDAAVRRWIKRVSPDLLLELYERNRADVLGKGRDASDDLDRLSSLKARVARLMAAGAAMSPKDLAVNGHDLMNELGIRGGPELGRVLVTLLDEVIETPELNQRETLIERARELLSGGGA